MAETQTVVPKARKILTIRQPGRTDRLEGSHFLRLPRELRDIIYEYALIEPTLWNKRHQPGCPLYRPKEPFERPVFKTNRFYAERDERDVYLRTRFRDPPSHFPYGEGGLKLDQVYICEQVCRRRMGIGLRCVNKQIYEETDELFWSSNTFCYTREKDVLHDLKGRCEWCKDCGIQGTVKPISESIKRKIQRLSFVEHRECGEIPGTREDIMENIIVAMESLPSLRHVELPANLLRLAITKFTTICLPQLATIGAGHFQYLYFGDGSVPLDLRFSKVIKLRSCKCRSNFGIRASVPERGMKWCYKCWTKLDGVRDELQGWMRVHRTSRIVTGRVKQCTILAQNMLERDGVPAHPEDGSPYELSLQVGDEKAELVRLHGLPAFDEKTGRKRAVAQRLAVRKTTLALASQDQALRAQCRNRSYFHESGLNGLELGPTGWEARERVRALSRKVNRLSGDSYLTNRKQRNENREALAAQQQKNAAKEGRRQLRRSMEEMKLEKRAERKRCSR